jgi:hypothetical protein
MIQKKNRKRKKRPLLAMTFELKKEDLKTFLESYIDRIQFPLQKNDQTRMMESIIKNFNQAKPHTQENIIEAVDIILRTIERDHDDSNKT